MNEKGTATRKIRRVAAVYLTLFLAILLFVAMYINLSSFRTQLLANEISLCKVSASRVVDQIQTGLLYGKSLDNYYGMEALLKNWNEENKRAVNVRLFSADKKEIYQQLADPSSYQGLEVDDSIFLEIRDSDDELCGYLNIVMDLTETKSMMQKVRLSFYGGAAILLLGGILAILAFCAKSRFLNDDLQIDKKKVLTFILLLIFAAEAAFTVFSYTGLRTFYTEAGSAAVEEIRSLIQADIDKVIGQGVTYDQIYDFDEYADAIIEQAPVIDSISIESISLDDAVLTVTVSKNYISKGIRRMMVDMLTILVTSMFITIEVVNFMILALNRRIGKIRGEETHDRQMSIRVSSFFIHIACYLPVSFIPIMMNELTGGTASDFVLGLPVMILFATGFAFTLIAGNWSARFGWKKVLLGGILLVAASSLLAGLLQNPVVLVIARGLYGTAYALVYVAIREYAAISSDREERSKGLAQVTAGLYAGLNIGAMLGAMIYETIGFLGVFTLSAFVAGIGYYIAKHYCVSETGSYKEQETATAGVIDILKNWDMMRLALFIIAPLAVSSVFFEYFLPVYAVKADISTADIGRAFLINGLAVAYAAPYLVKQIGSGENEKRKLFLFMMLMAAGFFLFGSFGGVASILIASAVMGVAEGTALVSQNMIMLDLEIAQRAGAGRMLSMYAAIRKLSQTAGPQIFAGCMLLGAKFGMVVFGVALVAFSMMYIYSGWIDRPTGK